ncbi:MAG: hypothetical protein MUF38_20370 [Anaerolineae bacterium]|jgi:hypothetical protein|nr:hypothetical protein [Anaerolineae bacterium]
MKTEQTSTVWRSILFILLILVVGLAAPILIPIVSLLLVMGGLWMMRQTSSTSADRFVGRLALGAGLVYGVFLMGLILALTNTSVVQTVEVRYIITPVGPEETPSL